jgi:catechol 2,3-dioxygenase-like lactoylglutathione lyase family enzyme
MHALPDSSSPITCDRIDHFVLTVASIDTTCEFYSRVLGMRVVEFESMGTRRVALAFGCQKINLHAASAVPDPNVLKPTPGAADFCLITSTPLAEVRSHLASERVEVILGPVSRTGATGKIESVYFRDPDLNLVEVANYLPAETSRATT